MYFKFVHQPPVPSQPDRIRDWSPDSFIIEAPSGRYKKRIHWDISELPFGRDDYCTYVGGRPPLYPGDFPVEVLWLTVPSNLTTTTDHTYLGCTCSLYIMNEQGKTIDKLEVLPVTAKKRKPELVASDRRIRRAENVIEWIVNDHFLGLKSIYPRQLLLLAEFFGDICYNCSDLEYIEKLSVDAALSEMSDRIVALEHGLCRKCQKDRFQILEKHRGSNAPYYELDALWGQRSGKSFILAVAATYHVHRLLSKSHFLSTIFDTSSASEVYGIFVDGSPKYTWQLFWKLLEGTEWYKRYIEVHGSPEGSGTTKSFQNGLVLKYTPFLTQTFQDGDAPYQGPPHAFVCLSEIGSWLKNNDIPVNRLISYYEERLAAGRLAEERRRREGKFGFGGLLLNFGTPAGLDDILWKRQKKSKKDLRILFSHMPTWEVNPNEPQDDLREGVYEVTFLRDFAVENFAAAEK